LTPACGATTYPNIVIIGVPSSSAVTLALAPDTIGVPVEGLALMLGIDRIHDMMRGCVNMIGQISAAVFVDTRTTELEKPVS